MNIAEYRIERKLGDGGMSTVYLALQNSLKRWVALKVMAPALTQDEVFVTRFIREARTVAQLAHSNIVNVYDIGTTDTQPYMAMEFLPGGNLQQRINGQPLSLTQVFNVTRGMASALSCAHAAGIVHRDIKPANILFRRDGSVVLGDFGIAKAMAGSAAVTALTKATSIGTPNYMSPEQAQGKKIDARSDQYGLGTVLYECLTGRTPYQGGDSFAIAFQHIYEPIPELPPVRACFQPLLNKLMAKDPADRFASTEDILPVLYELYQQCKQDGDSLAAEKYRVLNEQSPTVSQPSRWRRALDRFSWAFHRSH
ncbi:MAG: serine/threonine protein kinase [Candidatus Competibacteraceae bacterium]|nr:serine/threonine protein kinase [Candidatus Competibacteraceae bacterium]